MSWMLLLAQEATKAVSELRVGDVIVPAAWSSGAVGVGTFIFKKLQGWDKFRTDNQIRLEEKRKEIDALHTTNLVKVGEQQARNTEAQTKGIEAAQALARTMLEGSIQQRELTQDLQHIAKTGCCKHCPTDDDEG